MAAGRWCNYYGSITESSGLFRLRWAGHAAAFVDQDNITADIGRAPFSRICSFGTDIRQR